MARAPATAPSAFTSRCRTSTPLLLFVGQIPHGDAGRDAFQEIDYRQMFGSVAKWVVQIDQASRIPELVAHAVDVATSGRPGPVVIALSEEMQKELAEVPDLPRVPGGTGASRPGRPATAARHAGEGPPPGRGARRLLLERGPDARRSATS